MKFTKPSFATLSLSFFAVLAASAQVAMVKGEVKKIDVEGSKITLISGPTKNLDMEADNMTMVFRVRDAAMLKRVKPGDKLLVERVGLVGNTLCWRSF